MSRKKHIQASQRKWKQRRQPARGQNKTLVLELLRWFVSQSGLFSQDEFHGNTQWGCRNRLREVGVKLGFVLVILAGRD